MMPSIASAPRFLSWLALAAAAVLPAAVADEPLSQDYPDRISPPVFYEQLQPYWEAGPMTDRDIYYADPTEYAKKEDVLFQRGMLENPDEVLRSHAAMELARCNNREARGLLKDFLAREPVAHVHADLLSALLTLQADDVASLAKQDLAHANYRVRLLAARLYVAQPGADLTPIVQRAKAETQESVRQVLWQLLAEHPGAVSIADWQAQATTAAPYKWLAVQALASHPQAPGKVDLKTFVGSDDPAIRQNAVLHLSAGWSAAQALAVYTPLSQDPTVSVRASVAETILRLQTDGALPILVALSRDADVSIRLLATEALAYYGDRKAFGALVDRLDDKESSRIRQQAEDSLVALQERFDVIAALPVTFDHQATETRYHGYRLARRLNTSQYGTQLTERIDAEVGDPRLASALIATLGLIDCKPASEPILAQAHHEAPEVRAAAALALGRLGRVDQQQLLIDYVTAAADDEVSQVRHAAIEAMGYLPSGEFHETLLWVLTQVKMENNPIDGTARAIAMWSLGRIDNLDQALQKRMYTQMTRAVIPTPMGPVFEDDAVRVSAAWAAVEQYKRTGSDEMKAFAEKLVDVLKMPDPDGMASGPMIPTGEALREFGYQAEQYRDDAPTVPHEVTPVGYSFNYRIAKTEKSY